MLIELVLFVTALLFYYAIKDRKPKGMPPGKHGFKLVSVVKEINQNKQDIVLTTRSRFFLLCSRAN